MPPKRRNIGRLTNEARRKREKRRKEEAARQKERNSSCIAQLHSTKSSQQHKAKNEAAFDVGDISQDATNIDFVPVIKKEILDPSEENQEFILPDYFQNTSTIDPMWVVETEIQDSFKENKFILPNIKIEKTEIEDAVDKSLRTEERLSENFTNSETENSLTFKYKLTECSVLLHDCLIPKNLTSISSKFKSLQINTSISKTFPKKYQIDLFLSDAPFIPHISEAYKQMSLLKGKKNLKTSQDARPNIKKKKYYYEKSKRHICTCFKASKDAVISMGSEFNKNYSESTQQLCSCLTNDFRLSESIEVLVKEASLFDPDFGKITGGLNKMDYNF